MEVGTNKSDTYKKVTNLHSIRYSSEDCPVTLTIQVMGRKWKPLILYYLKEGTKRFSELHRDIPEASKKMLTSQLRELEADGIVHRKVYASVPPHTEYRITEYGKSLSQLLELMAAWGLQHQQRKENPDA